MKFKFFYSKSIFWQSMIFSLLISLLPILIISSYLFRKLEDMVVDEMMTYHEEISSQYTKNVNEKLQQYHRSLESIASNTVILNNLKGGEENPYQRGEIISDEVAKSLFLEKPSEVRICIIYSANEEFPAYGSSVSMQSQAKNEFWYSKERFMIQGDLLYFTSNFKEPVLSLIQKIEEVDTKNLKTKQLGIVKLDIRMKSLFSSATSQNEKTSPYGIYVCNEKNEKIYSSGENAQILENFIQTKDEEVLGMEKAEELESFVLSKTDMRDYKMKIFFLFDNKQLLERKGEIQSLVFPVIIFISLVISFGVYFYSRSFYSRMALLVNKFKIAETGDLRVKDSIEGNDEIALLDKKFSHMLEKLDRLIQTNYIQRLENKETQLRNLQLQINPHFLYNTLENISSIAAVEKIFEVSEICQKLGGIFRYSLGKDYQSLVSLKEELEHTKNYIFIQKFRFGNKFEVFYNLEEELLKYQVIRFILQPIVENAILHGIVPMAGQGSMEISIFQEEELLKIQIADDGIGMDREKQEELNRYINSEENQEDETKSIGIKNVNQRIKFYFGDSYGISIKSSPNRGSCFTLTLPMIKGGRADDEEFINRR